MAKGIINQKEFNENINHLRKKNIDFEVILFDGDEESQISNMIQSSRLSDDLIQIGRM